MNSDIDGTPIVILGHRKGETLLKMARRLHVAGALEDDERRLCEHVARELSLEWPRKATS